MPAVENWFGCSDGNLRSTASFTALARFSDSSCTTLLGTEDRIEALRKERTDIDREYQQKKAELSALVDQLALSINVN